MKNLVLIIASILFSNLPAIAESAQISNEQKIIEKQESQLEEKEKIDISVAKPDCADNKSNNWPDPSPDSEEYSHKININKGESANNWIADNPKDNIVEPNNKYTDYNNDFHIWANKVNNSVKPSSIKSGPTGLIKKVQ